MIMVDICRPFLNVASLCIHAGELGVRRSSTHHVFVIFRASSEILHAFLSATRIGIPMKGKELERRRKTSCR